MFGGKKIMKCFIKAGLCFGLAVFLCALPAEAKCDICNWRSLFVKSEDAVPQKVETFKRYANDENGIGLQNPNNRAVVHCYDSSEHSAEECAQFFEKNGYVRFKYIPYKTAKFDFLKVDTYPTRRWRPDELTSRW